MVANLLLAMPAREKEGERGDWEAWPTLLAGAYNP